MLTISIHSSFMPIELTQVKAGDGDRHLSPLPSILRASDVEDTCATTTGDTSCSGQKSSILHTIMRRIAVIMGAGPGVGAAVATNLSKTHSLLLLSRSLPGSLPKLKLAVPDDKVHAASSDGSRKSLDAAVKEVEEKWGKDLKWDVGVFNTGGSFAPGKFLERSEEDLRKNLESGV